MPTETYTFDDQFEVPTGVSEIDVTLRGGAGGDGSVSGDGPQEDGNDTAPGEDGGVVEGTLSVTGGDTVYIRFPSGGVGGTVNNNFSIIGGQEGTQYDAFGGNGGDGAEIRLNDDTPSGVTAVAGGGAGGGAAMASETNIARPSGAGGGVSGEDGEEDFDLGGAGGTQSNGYDRGAGEDGDEDPDSGETVGAACGGGGAGYYGGFSGEIIVPDPAEAGGSGGASSYTGGLDTVTTNSQGTHSGSAEVVIQYEAPPSQPQTVTATAVDNDTIEVDWDPVDNADSYNIYRATSAGVDTSGSAYASVSAPPVTDTPILDGTQFYYVVVGVNNVGEGEPSAEVTAQTPLPAPTDLTATDIGATTLDAAWTANHDTGESRLEAKPTDAAEWGDVAPGGAETTVAFDVETATLSGLRTGEAYDVRVVAVTADAEQEDV